MNFIDHGCELKQYDNRTLVELLLTVLSLRPAEEPAAHAIGRRVLVHVPESAVERGRDLVFEGASALASSHAKALVELDGADESAAILLPHDLHGVKVVARVETYARRLPVAAEVEEVDVRDGWARKE